METLEIHDSSDDTLTMLYTKYAIRAKEIGTLFGLTEDAILIRLKKLGIPTLDRKTKRADVEVHRAFEVSKRKEVTKAVLEGLLADGLSKADIARKFLTSETTITRRMQTFGIQYEEKETKLSKLGEFSKDVLENDYNTLTADQFSSKYGCSKTVWLPYLNSIGIARKSLKEPDPLTMDQKVVVLGSMLGDGSVSTGNTFYEYHCKEQESYLRLKHAILGSIAKPVEPSGDRGGFRFSTHPHPYFISLHPHFYKVGVPGKHIPVDLFKEYWDDRILAIWYLDDGTYDHRTDSVSIANKCPDKLQLNSLVEFLEERYHFRFQVSGEESIVQGNGDAPTGKTYRVTISKLFHREFFKIVSAFAPAELLGKIPEEYIPSEKVNAIPATSELLYKHPSLYRAKRNAEDKEVILNAFTAELVRNGFPYPYQTNKRLDYYLKEYLRVLPSYKGRVTLARSGYHILDHFFPSQFDAKRRGEMSPAEEWRSIDFVRKVATDVLNGSDTSNAAGVLSSVRRLCRGAITVQNPSISAFVYQNYNVNGIVLDTSSGFGPRMLSAMSLGLTYDGYEPNPSAFTQLQNLGNWIKGALPGSNFNLWCSGSEERKHDVGRYGLMFTSPPYFDFEEYSTASAQSTSRYPILMDWLTNYWSKVMRNAAVGLVTGGYFIVNLSPRSGDNIMLFTDREAAQYGLGLQDVIKVRYGGLHNGLVKEEWLLVFRKGYHKSIHTLSKDLMAFKEESKRGSSNTREVGREANRDRVKAGGLDCEKVKAELLGHVANGGSCSRDYLKSAWEAGDSPISEPTWVIEEAFGKWSDFVAFCGLSSNYETVPIEDQLRDYIGLCMEKGLFLSHYAYNNLRFDRNNPYKYSSRVKRLYSRIEGFQEKVEDLVSRKVPLEDAVQVLLGFLK